MLLIGIWLRQRNIFDETFNSKSERNIFKTYRSEVDKVKLTRRSFDSVEHKVIVHYLTSN
jgi:hypothetical protein